MFFDDLRSYAEELDKRGWVTKVDGADWDLEIGTLAELMAEEAIAGRANGALLFNNIKGYSKDLRILANCLVTPKLQRLAFGDPEGISNIEVIKLWRDRLINYKPVPAREVKSGFITENVITGDQIDLSIFPTPKWHEKDGGRYIGTGCEVITKDPRDGWINVGTYRSMVHERDVLSFYMSPKKHGAAHREEYWAKGEDCPVVMVFGGEPLLFWAGAQEIPWHEEELSWIGHIKGRPVEVIRGEYTGLPIPAQAEIAIEGFAPPPSREKRNEGPFGEYTGYYASGVREEPVVHVKAIYHRNDPIMFGQPPLKPPYCVNWPIPIHSATMLWHYLEMAGQRGIMGAWVHGTNGMAFPVVSIKQGYPGHSGEVATLAAAINYRTKIAIVVDEDIDPSNWEDVMWAVASRWDPSAGVQLVPGIRGSALSPWVPPERRAKRDFAETALVINACKPYYWKDQFPPVNRASQELRKKVRDKYINLFQQS